jgi:hypothetical protein
MFLNICVTLIVVGGGLKDSGTRETAWFLLVTEWLWLMI